MRKLTATICLTLAVLLGSEVRGFDLPVCQESPLVTKKSSFTKRAKQLTATQIPTDRPQWTECKGSHERLYYNSSDIYIGEWKNGKSHGRGEHFIGNGIGSGVRTKYVGEFSEGKWHGRGIVTFSDGSQKMGIWKDNKFQYARKVSPTVTARKSSPPSKSAAQKENDNLRKRIAELEKQNQSKPKLVAKRPEPNNSPTRLKSAIDRDKFKKYKTQRHGTFVTKIPDNDVCEGVRYGNTIFIIESKRRGLSCPKYVPPPSKSAGRAIIIDHTKKYEDIPTVTTKKSPSLSYCLDKWRSIQDTKRIDLVKNFLNSDCGQEYSYNNRSASFYGMAVSLLDDLRRNKNKRLRKEIARLKKQNQSKPKQVAKRPGSTKSPPPKSGTTGSGFFVSKLGHIVTNEHVVRQCGSVTVGDNANKQVAASVLETDKRNDLALLRISSTQMASAETLSLISKLGAKKLGLKLVPLASGGLMRSDDIELGESVLVAGYPYGELYSNTIKVTGGMVSAVKGMGDDSAQFQMDAAVQPGNSGGPIYDENGNIVGVVISQLNKLKVAKAIGSLPENVNFGIKASTVRQFLTSAGLPTKWSNRTEKKSTKELAQIAKNQTVMVVCNP